jgi:hypothetical protein
MDEVGTWLPEGGGENADVRRRVEEAEVRMDEAEEAAVGRPPTDEYDVLRICDGREPRGGGVRDSGVPEVTMVGTG